MYRYAIKNQFRPTQLAPNAYGWSTAPQYNRADIPTGLMNRPAELTQEQFMQQFAYEWYQSSQINAEGPYQWEFSNPPFVSGAAGRLHPALQNSSGQPARILRGYIRRAQQEAADQMSRARLYFMWNPEAITRDYVSYLEQGALDPFNTVYQSGNLVAPPSILDFSFDLFFDRQEEATDLNHPGVFVDYQFFDMVVRNVIPSDPNQVSNTLPDSGVMMVNPRDITVVFSPQLTVQGRPLNARVTFERFTHRMTPTRMKISLTMRAVYLGPIKEITEYTAETFLPEASIPFGEVENRESLITIGELEGIESDFETGGDISGDDFGGGEFPTSTSSGNYPAAYMSQATLASDGSQAARSNALNWAKANVVQGQTRYRGADTGSDRYNLPSSADCSGLVVSGYRKGVSAAAADAIFGGGYPGTGAMLSRWQSNGYKSVQKLSLEQCRNGQLRYGDILIKKGHVRFFDSYRSGGGCNVFEAASATANPQVGLRTISNIESSYIGIRPMPVGSNMNYSATHNATSGTATFAP